ncbi:MAG: exonuclease SbcCD subunit D [Ruminococcaceae bacterium]|nr:exonuclease SbcCD subunit D [Oscillospiraceae bacterium]
MKLIHLSDLHLGKRLKTFPLLEDQKYILKSILRIIDAEKPQAVLIAGDVYDKSVPSAEAVQLFDTFLNDLARRKLQVLIISGNHDSPERLAFGNRLMEYAGIHLSPVYDGQIKPVTLHDELGEVNFWMLPFLKPIHVRRYFPDESIESYTDALRLAIRQMQIDPKQRNILLTHQFVTGAETCESEELSVGGTDNIDAAVFDDFDYVALGHIHKPQNVGSNRIHYCGTPLKYSFSEEAHIKSVTVVKLGQKDDLKLETVPLMPERDVRRVCGSFEKLRDMANETQDYVHIVLTDEEEIPEAMGKLYPVFPNIVHLSYDNTRTRTSQVIEDLEDAQKKSPLEVFEALYEMQNNQPMSDEQRSYAQKLIEDIWEGEK